jgi:hypothetical protein
MVQVSWLEPVGKSDHGVTNEFTVYSARTDYADDNPVGIPHSAVGSTLWEPPDSPESVVFWLH